MASFTGITDIDREILLNLSYRDLLQACQVNKAAQSICAQPTFWKQRLLNEYGSVPIPTNDNYELQYKRLKEFQADPQLFKKHAGYQDAFREMFDDPDIFYEEQTDYSLAQYALDYGFIDEPYLIAILKLLQGHEISAGVYRQFTAQPDFSTELNLFAELTAKYPVLYKVGELFASNPSVTELYFKLSNGQMEIMGVIFGGYMTQEETQVKTTVPQDIGFEIIKHLMHEFHFVDQNADPITAV